MNEQVLDFKPVIVDNYIADTKKIFHQNCEHFNTLPLLLLFLITKLNLQKRYYLVFLATLNPTVSDLVEARSNVIDAERKS